MKKIALMALSVLIIVLGIVSCEKENSTTKEQITIEEAKGFIANYFSSYYSFYDEITESKQKEFLNFFANPEIGEEILSSLKKSIQNMQENEFSYTSNETNISIVKSTLNKTELTVQILEETKQTTNQYDENLKNYIVSTSQVEHEFVLLKEEGVVSIKELITKDEEYYSEKNGVSNGLSLQEPLVSNNQKFNYDPIAAKNYAYQHVFNYNNNYVSYNNDCANFISQCLEAGGWSYQNCWSHGGSNAWWYGCNSSHIHSYTWAKASGLRTFTLTSGRGVAISNMYNLKIGDILFADWTSNGSIDHVMIVTNKVGSTLYLTYHTTDRKDRSVWALPSGATFYTAELS